MDVVETIEYPLSWNRDPRLRKRPVFYDTLRDLPIRAGMSMAALDKLLFEEIRSQPEVQCTVLMGGRDTRWTSMSTWGVGLRFGVEVWYVRSSGRRRIGKPLRPGDIQNVAIMVCPADAVACFSEDPEQRALGMCGAFTPLAPGHARLVYSQPLETANTLVTCFRFRYRRPKESVHELLSKAASPKNESYGALGVPMLPPHLYEHQGIFAVSEVSGYKSRAVAAQNFHMLITSHANVYNAPEAKMPKNKSSRAAAHALLVPTRVEAGAHIGNVAASLVGVNMTDQTTTHAGYQTVEQYTTSGWTGYMGQWTSNLGTKMIHRHPSLNLSDREDARIELTWRARSDAIDLCNDLSMVGMLDMIADVFYDGALPDDVHRPTAGGLLISVAVRLACFPHRYPIACDELQFGTPNDMVASKRVADMFESCMKPLISTMDNDPMYAIDVLLRDVLAKIETDLQHARSSRSSKQARGGRGVDPDTRDSAARQALHSLFRHGIAVCNDVMGVLPQSAGQSYYHNEFLRTASECFDPLSLSRSEDAWASGLGVLHAMDEAPRCTSRGERLGALRRVLHTSELWIRTGKYGGRVLLLGPHDSQFNGAMQALSTVTEKKLESMRRPSNKDMTANMKRAFLEKPAPGSGKTVAGRMGGSTKSKSAKKRREQAFNAQQYTQEAQNKTKEIETALANSIDHQAFAIARSMAETIICQGPSLATQDFTTSAYVGSQYSRLQCSCCPRTVHITQGLGLWSLFGRCTSCNRRRCLECAQKYVSALDLWDDDTPRPREPTCLFCGHPRPGDVEDDEAGEYP